ncbi:helix-turn-helix transcriptional regulator [Acinetobacter thermotolerans]|uniref:helix-turn-helix transcriptional regulator n=1 Tax=Acinetobacter thermotolerans TaxID=3151487 RepID=UPI00325B54AE
MLKEDLIIENSLLLAKNYLDAEGAMFYWVDEEQRKAKIHQNIEVPQEFIHKYHQHFQECDPLNVDYFLSSHDNMNYLNSVHNVTQKVHSYKTFAADLTINEIFEVVFWENDHAFAGIAVTNPNEEKKIDLASNKALYHILKTNIFSIDGVKEKVISNYLNQHMLTYRESQLCFLILKGSSNQDIAEMMGISLGTVKINTNRIFEKLNVPNRLALTVLLNQLV